MRDVDQSSLTDVRRVDRLYSCLCGWWGRGDEATGAGVFGMRCPDCRNPVREFMYQVPPDRVRTDEQHAESKRLADERRKRRGAKRLKGWTGARL